jgi:hypothetical protein
MRRSTNACWVAALLLAAPAAAADKDKAAPKDKPEPPKLVPIARFAGTLQGGAGESSGTLKVRLKFPRIEPNRQAQANYLNQQRGWLQRHAQIMRNPNPFQAQEQLFQLLRDIQQAQQNLFVVKQVEQDVEVLPADDMKVRTAVPDPGFDDMGNIRELTPALLKELRGKSGLPGYKAERGDLKNGQTVLVVVSRERKKDAKPLATLVLILAQPKQ